MHHDLPYRELGKTGVKVSPIGVGGFHLGFPDNPEGAISIVRGAIDHGITFMNNSWDYHNGESERRLGEALKDGYRAFAPGGAIEAMVEARDADKVSFLGFTGRKDPDIHLKMLSQDFEWDTV